MHDDPAGAAGILDTESQLRRDAFSDGAVDHEIANSVHKQAY
jgi:hypothetical protein